MKSWISTFRDENPGRVRWAVNTPRPAKVGATGYVLDALGKIGILDETIPMKIGPRLFGGYGRWRPATENTAIRRSSNESLRADRMRNCLWETGKR